MSKISSLNFIELDIFSKNYLSWILDVEINLEAANLGETIKEGNQRSLQDRAKTLIFLRQHLHEDLKIEYLTVKDPLILWIELKKRFDHQKTVILPKARYDWMCDAPKPEGPLTTRQPAEYKWMSGYPTPLQIIGQSLLYVGSSTQIHYLHETCPK